MSTIPEHQHYKILELLKEIEKAENITIIHAVESGSRAWGFPSSDSDYDIRFIYHHPKQWYITPFEKKDHIEIAIEDELDTGGWDIGKSLRLLSKGNAAVHEWLNSPVVYRSDKAKYRVLKNLANQEFKENNAFYHYVSLAKKKFSDEKTRTNAKYFLYAVRALLCAKWIVENESAPPVLFDELSKKYLSEAQRQDLHVVMEEKAYSKENNKCEIPKDLWANCLNTYGELNDTTLSKNKPLDREAYDLALHTIIA